MAVIWDQGLHLGNVTLSGIGSTGEFSGFLDALNFNANSGSTGEVFGWTCHPSGSFRFSMGSTDYVWDVDGFCSQHASRYCI